MKIDYKDCSCDEGKVHNNGDKNSPWVPCTKCNHPAVPECDGYDDAVEWEALADWYERRVGKGDSFNE